MSAFTHSFNHGFMHGMFDRMFGGWNMPCFNNCTPMFFTPIFNFGGFTPYITPMPELPLPVVNFNTNTTSVFSEPKYEFNYDFDKAMSNFKFTAPDFSAAAMDTFTCSSAPSFTSSTTSSTSSSSSSSSASLKVRHWSEMTDSELLAVYGNYTRDVTKKYKGTAADLNKYLKGKGVLEGKGQAFIDAQNKYGISAAVLVGICMNESGKGTSDIAKNKNNIGGIRISGSKEFRTFNSVDESIDYMAALLKNHYVTNSGVSGRALTRLYQINGKYCPASETGSNAGWARNVEYYTAQAEKAYA